MNCFSFPYNKPFSVTLKNISLLGYLHEIITRDSCKECFEDGINLFGFRERGRKGETEGEEYPCEKDYGSSPTI